MNATGAEVMDRGENARPRKRTADESFDDDNRFAKRFNLLNLIPGSNGKLYIPVSTRPQLQGHTQPSDSNNEHMHVDDTKNRVYIHNLDEELAELESDDQQKLIFLPDIEKRLNAIPRHILMGSNNNQQEESQQLVLYSPPPSLSVPLEQDQSQKAILEARHRAMELSTDGPDIPSNADGLPPKEQTETAHGYGYPDYEFEEARGYDSPDYGFDEEEYDDYMEVDAMDLS